MSAPIIQVDCASCGTTYRLALPNVLVNKPQKSMSFRCNHCSYKFQIQPKEILEQDPVAATLILVEADGFHVHQNLESVADLIEKGTYSAEDTIRVFGQEWSMMADEPSLAELFQKGEVTSDEPPLVEGMTNPRDLENRGEDGSRISDVSLDFDESEDQTDAPLSEQDFSEIDPFSEGYSHSQQLEEDFGVDEDFGVVEESLDADFFGDALASSIDDEFDDFDDFVVDTIESLEDANAEINVEFEKSFDSLDQEHTIEATADVDHAIVDSLGFDDDETKVVDASQHVAANTLMAEFNDEQDESEEDFEDDFAVQAIQANLWEELEDSADDAIVDGSSTKRNNQIYDDTNDVDVNSTPVVYNEYDVQSTKSALLEKPASSSAMIPEMEFVDGGFDDSLIQDSEFTGLTEDSNETSTLGDTSESKPKQRLSFSNKVPEVKTVKKREINPLYFFAAVVLFCVGLIGYFSWKSIEQQNANFAGIETNSNLLKPMAEAKDGLQQNTTEDGTGPENTEGADGTVKASGTRADDPASDPANTDITERTPSANPFPAVLPDVPEESYDFANDKSSRELTREGYRALKDGKLDQAKKLFELALEKDRNFADALLGLGKTFQKRGEVALAKEAFCRHANLPSESFSEKTMVEDVGMAQGIVFQLGLTCDDA